MLYPIQNLNSNVYSGYNLKTQTFSDIYDSALSSQNSLDSANIRISKNNVIQDNLAFAKNREGRINNLNFKGIFALGKPKTKPVILKLLNSTEIADKKFVELLILEKYMLQRKGNSILAINDGKSVKIGTIGKTPINRVFSNYREALCTGVMINFSNMDPKKTYLGLLYRDSLLAKGIKIFTRRYCKDKDIPTHAMAFVHEDNKWWIYHACFKCPELGVQQIGTARVPADEFVARISNVAHKLEVYPMNINKSLLKENLGQHYGYGALLNFVKVYFRNNNGSQLDAPGLTCSEYVARALQETPLPPWCISPAHLKSIAKETGVTAVK